MKIDLSPNKNDLQIPSDANYKRTTALGMWFTSLTNILVSIP